MENRDINNEILLLSFSEILLLLQSLGYTSVRGIRMDIKKAGDGQVVQMISRLVNRGLLIPEEGRFRIEEHLGYMLICMGEPEHTYETEYDGELFYCYERKDKALVTSIYQRREDVLELRLFTADELKVWKEEMQDAAGRY